MPEKLVEKFCDCAHCGRACLGEKTWGLLAAAECERDGQIRLHVAGRIGGRPWCNECLSIDRPKGGVGRVEPDPAKAPAEDDEWAARAMKLLEDGR
jgi:hypothetical protein